jgi:DNA primase
VGIIGGNIGYPRWPKYKNPPHTHTYNKSVNLYQPLHPRTDKNGQVVIVEGTLDAMAIAISAIRTGLARALCPITRSGRELSNTQLRRVVDVSPGRLVLGFDSDQAGRESARRYSRITVELGGKVTTAILDKGHDPASWLALHGDARLHVWTDTSAASLPFGAGRQTQCRDVTLSVATVGGTPAPCLPETTSSRLPEPIRFAI